MSALTPTATVVRPHRPCDMRHPATPARRRAGSLDVRPRGGRRAVQAARDRHRVRHPDRAADCAVAHLDADVAGAQDREGALVGDVVARVQHAPAPSSSRSAASASPLVTAQHGQLDDVLAEHRVHVRAAHPGRGPAPVSGARVVAGRGPGVQHDGGGLASTRPLARDRGRAARSASLGAQPRLLRAERQVLASGQPAVPRAPTRRRGCRPGACRRGRPRGGEVRERPSRDEGDATPSAAARRRSAGAAVRRGPGRRRGRRPAGPSTPSKSSATRSVRVAARAASAASASARPSPTGGAGALTLTVPASADASRPIGCGPRGVELWRASRNVARPPGRRPPGPGGAACACGERISRGSIRDRPLDGGLDAVDVVRVDQQRPGELVRGAGELAEHEDAARRRRTPRRTPWRRGSCRRAAT